MLCTKPILLTNLDKKRFPEGLLVSCGSCINCIKQRSREWALRLDHEREYCKYSFFVTLTYSPENIPKCYSVVKWDLQRYIKRLRKNTQSEIKYYACGEYGGKLGRPHYHALIYVYDEKYKKEEWEDKYDPRDGHIINSGYLSAEWALGIVKIGTVTTASINYVVGYIDKKIMKYHNESLGTRKNPFRIMSNGMGKKHALDNAELYKKELSIQIRDKYAGLPRFYKKILKIDPKQLQKKSKSLEFEKLKKYMKQNNIKKMDVNQWDKYYKITEKQKALNAEAKYNLYKKDRQF